MPFDQRSRGKLQSSGPFVARVTSVLDPTFMGSMEVAIEKGFTSDADLQSQTYIVQYLSPFYGVTNVRYEGGDARKFDDVQKSYGFWMVPPDVGTRVLVIFVDGDPNQGYWIGCIQDKFQNHMIPGLSSSSNNYITPEEELMYGTKELPVTEFHKKSADPDKLISPNAQTKAIHPFASRLMAQGLLLDNVRGVTSSSARREIPSSVFGISTPGPLDTEGRKTVFGYNEKKPVPINRLGGTQFVMDDGDEYGQNELVRIRTRTGHQILLHNSADLVYIANANGTAWLELTSQGKIDIYAKDSVSIHSEQDFNFRADRDLNFEAGRNVNIRSAGSANINVEKNINEISLQNKQVYIGGDFHTYTSGTVYQETAGDFNILSAGNNKFSATGDTSIKSGGYHKESANQVHMNSPSNAAVQADNAQSPVSIRTFALPNRSNDQKWADSNYYQADSLLSISLRVPTFEPWDEHENLDPTRFTKEFTDNLTTSTNITLQNYTDSVGNPVFDAFSLPVKVVKVKK